MTATSGTASAPRDTWIPVTRAIWHKAWDVPSDTSMQSLCAKIACIVFPIILVLACGECIAHACMRIWNIFHPVKTVPLEKGSMQFDIAPSANDPHSMNPPACTFHAVVAIKEIGPVFDLVAKEIEEGKIRSLSNRQKAIIQLGLRDYNQAVSIDPTFKEGANLEDIRKQYPRFIQSCEFENTREETDSVPVRTQRVVDRLFADTQQKRVAWIKSGNETSFAVIYNRGRVIIFDSHQNEMTLIRGKEQTRAFLTAKLIPFSNIINGIDATPFSYAIGLIP